MNLTGKILDLTLGLTDDQYTEILQAMIERLRSEQKERQHSKRRELSAEVHNIQNEYSELPAATELFISKHNSELSV